MKLSGDERDPAKLRGHDAICIACAQRDQEICDIVRCRGLAYGQVWEQDLAVMSPDDWAVAVKKNPSFATWSTTVIGGLIVALQPPLALLEAIFGEMY